MAAPGASPRAVQAPVKQRAVHRSFTVKLIATPVKELVTCDKDESPEQARRHVGTGSQQSDPPFDYLPVREQPSGLIVGFFSVRSLDHDSAERVVNSPGFVHLSERHRIGARTPILEFIQRADDSDCRRDPRVRDAVESMYRRAVPSRLRVEEASQF